MLELILGRRGDGRAITTARAENPHISVDGISGSGKSFKLKQLAEDAVCQGAQVIVFDYTGDFAAYSPPEGLPLQRMDVTNGELRINPLSPTSGTPALIRGQRLVNLLLAGSRFGTQTCTNFLKTTIQYLNAEPGFPDISGLMEYIEGTCPRINRLRSALGPLKSLSLLTTSGPEDININLNNPELFVLDFSQVESSWMRQLMVELLLRVIWDNRTSMAADGRHPLVLLLDECQNLNWRQDGMPVRILRKGRKFEIGAWFASQWIENERARTALRQAAMQMHFRQDPAAAARLAQAMALNDPERRKRYMRLLCSLRKGSFIIERPNGRLCIGYP